MSSTLNISVQIPYALGTFVYITSKLEVLWEHSVAYEDLIKYRIAGYEINSLQSSGVLTNTVGNAIIEVVQVGATETTAGARVYIPDSLLTISTPELEQRINYVVTGGV